MTDLLPISGAKFRPRLVGKPLSDIDAKEKPRLHWIAISALRVDHRYQRMISGRSSDKSVLAIATAFSWAKFAPVVVAELDEHEGLYAVIDGQHRTTAAAIRGIRDVPCLVMKANLVDQANAFAAINGSVTPISTMQLHHARIAAGDPAAVALRDACAAGGVTICRYPVHANEMKVGETLAASKLAQQLERYGRRTFVIALSCITKTRDGNVGMVRPQVVEALCSVLNGEPEWASDIDALLAALQDFDFFEAYATARRRAIDDGGGATAPLVEMLGEHLEKAMAEAV